MSWKSVEESTKMFVLPHPFLFTVPSRPTNKGYEFEDFGY